MTTAKRLAETSICCIKHKDDPTKIKLISSRASLRKCHELEPEMPSSNRDSNPRYSIDRKRLLGRQTCLTLTPRVYSIHYHPSSHAMSILDAVLVCVIFKKSKMKSPAAVWQCRCGEAHTMYIHRSARSELHHPWDKKTCCKL